MESKKNTSEINELIKKNEEILMMQKDCEDKIQTLTKENNKKKEEIKTKNNSQELFDLIISELKDYITSQSKTNEIIEDKQKLQNEINNAYYKAKQASQNYEELEKYNSDIIKKINEIKEEKNKIEDKLKQTYEETKAQCEKFKEEYQKKYDEISNDVILKENEELKTKIKECKENTDKIKQNIKDQMEMRQKQSNEITNMLNGQISDKLGEINKETNKYDEENAKLKIDIAMEKEKFGDNPDLMKDFNKKFDRAKKEYEKVFKDYAQLVQENRKLKEIDPVSIQQEISRNKKLLDDLVKNNKELQAKIKDLKNKKNTEVQEIMKEEKTEFNKIEDKKEEPKKEDEKLEDKKDEPKKEEEPKKEDEKLEDKKDEPKKDEEPKKEKVLKLGVISKEIDAIMAKNDTNKDGEIDFK